MKLPLLLSLAVLALMESHASAQGPTLSFPGMTAAQFESGSVIRLPKTLVSSTIDVSVAPTVRTDNLSLRVDDDLRLRIQAFKQGDRLILEARTPEPLGFFRSDEQPLRLVQMSTLTEKLAEWTILRWKNENLHLEGSRSTPGGRAPDLAIDEPKGHVFVFRTRPEQVTIRGRILALGDFLVRVAGADVRPVPMGEESSFAAEATLAQTATAVEVYVENRQTGATRYLVLPVVISR